MADAKMIEYRADNGVVVLEINRPPVNSYTTELLKELDAAVLDARFDDDVHAIDDDLFGCRGDGHEAGRTLPLERHARHLHRVHRHLRHEDRAERHPAGTAPAAAGGRRLPDRGRGLGAPEVVPLRPERGPGAVLVPRATQVPTGVRRCARSD